MLNISSNVSSMAKKLSTTKLRSTTFYFLRRLLVQLSNYKYYEPINTCGDLPALLEDPAFGNAGCLEMVDVIMPPLYVPSSVIKTGAAIGEFNKAKAVKGVQGA
ncbi:unnamed protein product [Fusarium equiseti]|uniref:Uncharacterized protein n=1 Tax=Fusarium equiseti TaxID=61235 RepID=A0A8J2NCC1_FUSEQ|nr:unnamed protein product [Fusarium equiseti]